MKSIIFLADGMADDPLAELGNFTPVEKAATPGMDEIARRGASGIFLTLPEGLPTSSDVANMSVLGFLPEKFYPGRGPIEAASQGIELGPDDVAMRCNLVTVSGSGILEDYSAGHIENDVSRRLMEYLETNLGSEKATFHHGVSYRNLLVLHGREFSSAFDYQKPDSSHGIAVSELRLKPHPGNVAAAHTVEFLEQLGAKAHELLKHAPVKSAATDIWPWSPGRKPAIPAFSERYAGKKGAIISAVDVIKGIGRCTGMTVFDVPGATGFVDTNYEGKAQAAIRAIEDHDLVYVHVEAIDECSHMGDLKLKMKAIEDFDARVICPVMRALEGREINFAILPDHPVPILLRKHTTTPVPVAVCGPAVPVPDGVTRYSEREALEGALGRLDKDRLVKLLLGIK